MSKLIGIGATAKIYREGEIASKVYTNATVTEVENEMKRQQFAYDTGLAVPQAYEVKTLDDGCVVLTMDYVNGAPLMHLEMSEVELIEAMKILVKLQCDIHQFQASELPKLTDDMTAKILATNLDTEVKNKLLAFLTQLSDKSEQLCHGDFHPLNVLFDGEKYWIIDWVDATAGSPYADMCRTYVLLKSQVAELAGLYLQVLCAEMAYEIDDILKWQPIVGAARLSENIGDSERADLENLVMDWYRGL